MKRRTTIRDIADRAGYHFTTVSLALRNHPSIPPSTRKKIKKAARELNYRPDPMLSSLMAYRRSIRPAAYQSTIAWVTNHDTRSGWSEKEMMVNFFDGARARATALGYKLEEFWIREPGLTPKRAVDILKARNIAGLLLAPQQKPNTVINLDWKNYSAVTIGYTLSKPVLHLAVNHQSHGIIRVMKEMHRRGYRRCELVLSKRNDERADHNWRAGHWIEQQKYPKSDRVPLLAIDDWNEKAFMKWFDRYRPDAIITIFPKNIECLEKQGLKIPENIGVAFYSLSGKNKVFSGMRENAAVVGGAALDYLVNMMQRNERGLPKIPQRLLIEGTWQEGKTVRRIPKGGSRKLKSL